MRRKLRYIWEWLKYTPFFFRHCPPLRWYRYFASCHRIAHNMCVARDCMADAADKWDRDAKRIKLLHAFDKP